LRDKTIERKIAEELASGKEYKEIADEQHVSFRDISSVKKRGEPQRQQTRFTARKGIAKSTEQIGNTIVDKTRGQIAAEVFPLFQSGKDVVQTVIQTSHDPEIVEDLHKIWRDSNELTTQDFQKGYEAGLNIGRELGSEEGRKAGIIEGDKGGYKRGCDERDAIIKRWRYMYTTCSDCTDLIKIDLLDVKDRKLIVEVIDKELSHGHGIT